MKTYDDGFYKNRNAKTRYSAQTILSTIVERLPALASAADLGCGVGTWLSVLEELGAAEVQGFDGPWVDTNLLEIPANSFHQVNLGEAVRLDRRFDLAISLEVAEHLPASSAPVFVDSLVGLSDFVLFSAAIPQQGGRFHVNEQWPDYWAALFEERGYVPLDLIRSEIWTDERILVAYRQNILFYVKQERLGDVQLSEAERGRLGTPLSLVHPRLFTKIAARNARNASVTGSLKSFRKALKASFRR